MAVRYPGQARIDPSAPEAVGVCDRCGRLWNLRDLRPQPVWAGARSIELPLLVCEQCWDIPNEQLRTIVLPPDPPPVYNARTENFALDEKNFLELSKITGWPYMFYAAVSGMTCELDSQLGIVALFGGVSDLTADLVRGVLLAPTFDGVSDLAAELQRDAVLAPTFGGVSDLAADLLQLGPPVTRTLTDTFFFVTANTFTETGAAIGAADANRLVFVAVSGANNTALDGFDSVTIGGIAATLAIEELRQPDTDPTGAYISSIYWANVPTGTTANIVLTFTGDTVLAAVGVYRVMGADTTTPIASTAGADVATGPVSASVTPGDTTVTIATSFCGANSTAADITWVNATEDWDIPLNVGAFFSFGGASRDDATSPGSISIEADAADSNVDEKTIAIAVIQPA